MSGTKKRPRSRTPTTKTPSEIAPGVYVGSWEDAVKFEGARFCVLDERPAEMPEGVHIQIYDEEHDRADPKALDRLAKLMGAAHTKGKPVLVFCGQGVYRSPLGAAWYLHRQEGLSLEQAYERVCGVRPRAKPAAGWLGNYAEVRSA